MDIACTRATKTQIAKWPVGEQDPVPLFVAFTQWRSLSSLLTALDPSDSKSVVSGFGSSLSLRSKFLAGLLGLAAWHSENTKQFELINCWIRRKIHPSTHLFSNQPKNQSINQPINQSIHQSINLSFRPSIDRSIDPPIHSSLSIHPSISIHSSLSIISIRPLIYIVYPSISTISLSIYISLLLLYVLLLSIQQQRKRQRNTKVCDEMEQIYPSVSFSFSLLFKLLVLTFRFISQV